jgi:hypothetical protein
MLELQSQYNGIMMELQSQYNGIMMELQSKYNGIMMELQSKYNGIMMELQRQFIGLMLVYFQTDAMKKILYHIIEPSLILLFSSQTLSLSSFAIVVVIATTKLEPRTSQTPTPRPVPCSIVAFLRKYRQRSPITNAACLYMNKYVCAALSVAALRISGLPLVPPPTLLTAVTNQISGFCHLTRQFFCLYSLFLILASLLTLESHLFTLCNKTAAMAPTAASNYWFAVVQRYLYIPRNFL